MGRRHPHRKGSKRQRKKRERGTRRSRARFLRKAKATVHRWVYSLMIDPPDTSAYPRESNQWVVCMFEPEDNQ